MHYLVTTYINSSLNLFPSIPPGIDFLFTSCITIHEVLEVTRFAYGQAAVYKGTNHFYLVEVMRGNAQAFSISITPFCPSGSLRDKPLHEGEVSFSLRRCLKKKVVHE